MKLKLYGAPLSPFVRKARVVLAEKNITYDYEPRVSPAHIPEGYEKIHPLKKIPALVVEDANAATPLADSTVIAQFLEKISPSPRLYPEDPLAFGQVLWIEEYADTLISKTCTFDIFGAVFFSKMAGDEPDLARVKDGFKGMQDILVYLEDMLCDNDWLVGDAFSMADLAVVTHFFNVEHAGYQLAATDSATIHALKQRVEARPSVAEIFAGEKKTLAKMGFQAPDLAAVRDSIS